MTPTLPRSPLRSALPATAGPTTAGPTTARPTLRDLLRPPPTVQAPFTPASLGASAQGWAALLRDGDLVEVRPGFAVGPGTAITPELRALALTQVVPRGVVVGRASAAWVHTGHGDGPRVCVLYAPGGHRPRHAGRLEVCQAAVRPWEIDTIAIATTAPGPGGGTDAGAATALKITTLVRTAMDVATWCPPQESAALLDRLVAAGLDLDDALHRLDLVASWRGAETARIRLLAARRRARGDQTLASGFDPVIR